MLIGINLLYLIPGKVGGTETYARELIPVLSKTEKLILFCDRVAARTFKESKNVKIVTLPFNSASRISRLIIEQTLLPFLCSTHHIDILFSLGYSAPLIHSCPSVVTIHDLNWYYHPEDFSSLNRFVWEWLTRMTAKFSNHVITDSRASAESLIKVLALPPTKVTPILHSTPTKVKPKKYNISEPYIFTVVANYPHKNLSTLLKAFKFISGEFPDLNLVVCGLGNQAESTSRIKYLGYVSREELAYLYTHAELFVFPSAYEGFGYPVLEAMSYGTPVLSSKAYSLSEVVGDGGILVQPFNVEEYVAQTSLILKSKKLRQELIAKGRKRAGELEWKQTSTQTLAVLRKAKTL